MPVKVKQKDTQNINLFIDIYNINIMFIFLFIIDQIQSSYKKLTKWKLMTSSPLKEAEGHLDCCEISPYNKKSNLKHIYYFIDLITLLFFLVIKPFYLFG